jgi:chaperonin cofactor prefoldin
MDNTEKLQNILRDIQATRQQSININSQIKEFEVTLEALSNQEDGKKVYRQIGALLFEVDDMKNMEEQLISSIETLKEHLSLMEKQDQELKEKYEERVSEIENN